MPVPALASLGLPGARRFVAAVAAAVAGFGLAEALGGRVTAALPGSPVPGDVRGWFLLHAIAFLAGTEAVDRAVVGLPGGRRLPWAGRVVEALAFLPLTWLLWDVFPGPVRSRTYDGEFGPQLDGLYVWCSLLVAPPVLAASVLRRFAEPGVGALGLAGLRGLLPLGILLFRAAAGDVGLRLGGAVVGAAFALGMALEVGKGAAGTRGGSVPAGGLGLSRRVGTMGSVLVGVGLVLACFAFTDVGWRLPGLSTLLPLRELAAAGAPWGPLGRAVAEGRVVTAWSSEDFVSDRIWAVRLRCGPDCGWVVPGSERLQGWAAARNELATPEGGRPEAGFWLTDGARREVEAVLAGPCEGGVEVDRVVTRHEELTVDGCADGLVVWGRQYE